MGSEDTVGKHPAAGVAVDDSPRSLVTLDPAEALALLAGIAYGRLVFTDRALPAIRPVNHLVDDGEIIIRTRLQSKASAAISHRTSGQIVVAYEADDIDPLHRTGWSVVATGIARPVTDPDRIARYEAMLKPWVDRVMDAVVAIRPEIITGFRLTEP